jgi:sugar O-acyltransferase (sialic acid O-acetyltransferase NeuD family)
MTSAQTKLVIFFGIGKIAEVIHYYATEECNINIAAFVVDKKYKSTDSFLGLPVIDFEEVQKLFPPEQFDMFIAIGYHEMNSLRELKCNEAIDKGYTLINIISPNCKLPKHTKIGYNCFIMPPAIIHPCVSIGNNVFVWSGGLIGHHSIINDNVWITSCANIGGNVSIGKNTFIAINATIGHSVAIGANCFLGANSLVTKKLEDDKVVIAESSKPIKLTSKQFLKFSSFSSL